MYVISSSKGAKLNIMSLLRVHIEVPLSAEHQHSDL